MPHLIIDGYNVIGTGHRDLKKERDTFIDLISQFCSKRGHSCIIVFDGYNNISKDANIQYLGCATVIYTPINIKADDYIIEYLRSHQKKWIVVSSDKYIQQEAWRCGCVALSSSLFLEIVCFTNNKVILTDNIPHKKIKELQRVIESL